MEVITLGKNYNYPIVLCLGFFDCMHLGHIKLLRRGQLLAGRTAKVVLFTFKNNHFATLGRPTKLLFTFNERLQLYRDCGVDAVLCAEFNEDFMHQTGEEFLSQISRYNLKGVVFGEDYTCGSDLISAEDIKNILRSTVSVDVVQIVTQNGQKISSSRVRNLLSEHRISEANELLSQPFFFEGTVIEGRHQGAKLGFPTANLAIPHEKLIPEGVYVGKVTIGSSCYKAIVNIGNAPTFDFSSALVEAHLLHFDGNLYGKKIKISLLNYIRPIQKFSNISELSMQLSHDCEVADDQIRA